MLHEKALFDAVNQSEDQLTAYLTAARAQDLQSSLKAVDTSGGIFFWVLILTGGFVALVAWLTIRGIMRSLDQLVRAATLIGQGDLGVPIEIGGAVEFARLGTHMDWMRRQLDTQRVLSEILGSSLQVDSVWAAFAADVRDLAPFDQLILSELDADGALLTTLYTEGPTADHVQEASRRMLVEDSLSLVQPSQRCLVYPDISLLPSNRVSATPRPVYGWDFDLRPWYPCDRMDGWSEASAWRAKRSAYTPRTCSDRSSPWRLWWAQPWKMPGSMRLWTTPIGH